MFIKKQAQPLLKNDIFETGWLGWINSSKTVKTCQNQYAEFLRFLFKGDSLQTQKDLELVSRTHFLMNVFRKFFFLLSYYINWPNLITRLCFFPKYSIKDIPCFVLKFNILTLTFEYLSNEKSF